MTKYVVRFFSSFCSSEECKQYYERMSQVHLRDDYGIDKQYYITANEDYTHAIILNTAMPALKLPKERVIGFAHEPPPFLGLTQQFVEYAQRQIGAYYIGSLVGLPAPFRLGYGYLFHIRPPIQVPRKKLMSIVVSQKNLAPGHKYRHHLVQRILRTQVPIDVYGRGTPFYSNLGDSRIKGTFTENEPYEGYRFHIAIENYQTDCYVSEKLVNPLLWGITPLYWGAIRAESTFPGCFLRMTGNLEDDFRLIMDVLDNPGKYEKVIPYDQVRKTVDILENLDRVFVG